MLLYNDKTIQDTLIDNIKLVFSEFYLTHTNDRRFYPIDEFFKKEDHHISYGSIPIFINPTTIQGIVNYPNINIDPEIGIKKSDILYGDKTEVYDLVDMTTISTNILINDVTETVTVELLNINKYSISISLDSTEFGRYASILNKYNRPTNILNYFSSLSPGWKTLTYPNLKNNTGFVIGTKNNKPFDYKTDNLVELDSSVFLVKTNPGDNVIYIIDSIFNDIVGSTIPNIGLTNANIPDANGIDTPPLLFVEMNPTTDPWILDSTDNISEIGTLIDNINITYKTFNITLSPIDTATQNTNNIDTYISFNIVGGFNNNGNGILNSHYRYNSIFSLMRYIGNIPQHRALCTLELNHILCGEVLGIDKYISSTNTWNMNVSAFTDNRWYPTSFNIQNNIYIMGGWSRLIYSGNDLSIKGYNTTLKTTSELFNKQPDTTPNYDRISGFNGNWDNILYEKGITQDIDISLLTATILPSLIIDRESEYLIYAADEFLQTTNKYLYKYNKYTTTYTKKMISFSDPQNFNRGCGDDKNLLNFNGHHSTINISESLNKNLETISVISTTYSNSAFGIEKC